MGQMRAAVGRVIERRTEKIKIRLPRLPFIRRAEDTESDDGSGTAVAAAERTPTAYRTFSRKLAPSLGAFGGVLAVLGAVGPWIRATSQESEAVDPEQLSVTLGYEETVGVAIAILGGLALVASLIWLMRKRWIKILPFLLSMATAGLIGWRMTALSDEVDDMASAAREAQALDFFSFHVGLGWGAWLLIAASVLLVIGASVGALRELDLRKGIPDEA